MAGRFATKSEMKVQKQNTKQESKPLKEVSSYKSIKVDREAHYFLKLMAVKSSVNVGALASNIIKKYYYKQQKNIE